MTIQQFKKEWITFCKTNPNKYKKKVLVLLNKENIFLAPRFFSESGLTKVNEKYSNIYEFLYKRCESVRDNEKKQQEFQF